MMTEDLMELARRRVPTNCCTGQYVRLRDSARTTSNGFGRLGGWVRSAAVAWRKEEAMSFVECMGYA